MNGRLWALLRLLWGIEDGNDPPPRVLLERAP
jgi:hypothetical protein